MPSCPFGASLAAARLRDLVLEQGAPLFIVHSFVVVYAGALGCPPALLAPYLQLRDYTISSFNKAHLCSSFTRFVVVCRSPWVPFSRLAPHLQLRDYAISSLNKAHLCSSFTRCVVVCRCPWVPSCPFGASLAAARLHDLVHIRATVAALAQVMLLYAAKQHTYVIFLIFFLDLPA